MKTAHHSEKSKDQNDKIHCLISCHFSNPKQDQEENLSFPGFLWNNKTNNKDFLENFLPTLARIQFIPHPHPTHRLLTLPYPPLNLKTPPDLVWIWFYLISSSILYTSGKSRKKHSFLNILIINLKKSFSFNIILSINNYFFIYFKSF